MTVDVKTMTICRVCGASDWCDVISFGSMSLANTYVGADTKPDDQPTYPLEVMRCRSCHLVCLRHIVNPEALYRDYFYVTATAQAISHHMQWLASVCMDSYDVPRDGLVVEIGSNIGTQLQIFQQAGARVLGVDPAKNLWQIAERNGVPTIPDFFGAELASATARDHGNAHMIIGRHVFAHIDDLTEIMTGICALLRRDGVFVVEVPYLLDLLSKNQFDTIYHEHLSYFSIATLNRLFQLHGFQLLDVRHAAVHGGSVVVFAGHADGKWHQTERVAGFLETERQYRLDENETYHHFSNRVEKTKQELRSCLRAMTGDGLTVAGYGAPAKGNTLLNMCGISVDEIAFCTDTTEQKQGKMIAGTRIPIRAPRYAEQHRPDAYLLLAWNYAKEIIRNEFDYLNSGGRFIIPIPEVVTVSSATLVDSFFDTGSNASPAGEHWPFAFPG